MRTAFIHELILQARTHPAIFLVVGDLGYSVVEPFASEFPDRFLNAGVAEQNMTGVAAGLASEGYRVFTYSIANFPTLRCLEQIRNDICYHDLPVTIVSVGAGLAYGNLGYSHHAVQDIAILRTLPALTLLAPADPGETRECVQWLAQNPSPSYLRLGKAGEPSLHTVGGIAQGPLLVRAGTAPYAIAATGSVLKVAIAAHDLAAQSGPGPAVFSCPWLKPVCPAFFKALADYPQVLAIEEHVTEGGLCSILRENLPSATRVEGLSLTPDTVHLVGGQEFLRRHSKLTPQDLIAALSAIV